MSRSRSNIVKDVRFAVSQMSFAHIKDGTFDYNQADLLWYDSVAKIVKALDTDAHAAYLVGVAMRGSFLAPFTNYQQITPGVLKSYYDSALLGFGCIASFFSTAGETYYDNDQVFLGGSADPQIICNTAGNGQGGNASHPVGIVKMPAGNASGTISGGSAVLVPVLVIPQFPIASL